MRSLLTGEWWPVRGAEFLEGLSPVTTSGERFAGSAERVAEINESTAADDLMNRETLGAGGQPARG